MITRRELLGGGAFGAATAGGAGAQPVAADPRQVRELVAHLEAIADQLGFANGGSFTGTSPFGEKIRDAMTIFLRANQKYPDFIDVGYLGFHAIYDWHIRNRVPLTAGRSTDGRYGLVYMFTRLVLRPDAVPDFIGLPYDQRA
jgi:hypothetical protein